MILVDACKVQVNDTYKPRMHKMYATYLNAAVADFSLKVRKSPVTLKQVRDEDPELYEEFCCNLKAMQSVCSLSDDVIATLRTHVPMEVSEAQLEFARKDLCAPIQLLDIGGVVVALSSGPVAASSNTETSTMQLVQQT
eukprot:gene3268-4117_t